MNSSSASDLITPIVTIFRKCKEDKVPWTSMMEVQIMTSDICHTMGDVMREIDAAAMVRGYFVLLGVNTITNVNFAALLEQHM